MKKFGQPSEKIFATFDEKNRGKMNPPQDTYDNLIDMSRINEENKALEDTHAMNSINENYA